MFYYLEVVFMYIWHLNNAVICYYDTYINMYAYTVYYYITFTIV